MYSILIVEDELIAAEYIKTLLTTRGWDVVDIVDNGVDVVKSVKKHNPDLILMDIMINGAKSGCEIAIDIRKFSNCSIVFLTAYADDEMISYAMQVEADGYIIKPYKENEIIATISLLASKKHPNTNGFKITKLKNGFYFNHDNNLLYQDNSVVKLGPKAIKLIQILCNHRDTVVSYEELYNKIWDGKLNTKKLQMVVYRIREICKTNLLENINGVGYQILVDHTLTYKD
jgi:DNA-binding response OmpR family regulator